MSNPIIAIIGGSGLCSFDAMENIEEIEVETPFGKPSSTVTSGTIGGVKMLFLARHGKGHTLLPSEVNYRANIFALKKLGAERVVSISAVGSMREDIHPGDIVIPDQYIDRTKGRQSTFFGEGIVGHVMFADPTCAEQNTKLLTAALRLRLTVHGGGTLMVMEGPAFSTRAESMLHRQIGVDLIGMTAMPEAKLAREAELCYSTVALATDYDCWHEEEEDVSVMAVLDVMRENTEKAKKLIEIFATESDFEKRTCPCSEALRYAIVTERSRIPAKTMEKMKPIFGRIL